MKSELSPFKLQTKITTFFPTTFSPTASSLLNTWMNGNEEDGSQLTGKISDVNICACLDEFLGLLDIPFLGKDVQLCLTPLIPLMDLFVTWRSLPRCVGRLSRRGVFGRGVCQTARWTKQNITTLYKAATKC